MKRIPKVLYEDNHLLVLDKPSGWLVQSDESGDATLTDWGREYIQKKYNKPGDAYLHPVHRIDRPVSGIVIFGRTSKGLERMNKLFREDQIKKTYLAVVKDKPEELEATLVHHLEKDEEKNLAKAYTRSKSTTKRSELSYRTLAVESKESLLEVRPQTGRPHQIRVQLAKIDCPIVGDLKYGYPKANKDQSIALHAYKIEFEHPIKLEPVKIISKPNWPLYKSFIDALD